MDSDAFSLTQRAVPTRLQRAWVLLLLTLAYTSSFMDRTILSVVQEYIKRELLLSDTQLGLLSGFAFAIFYSALGIPLARMAETMDRRWLMSAALVIWSAATALCGAASSYALLFAARIGVGVGEAGASPPAHSLIADHFPPERRASAISVYTLGIPAGILFGSILGGYVAAEHGWRMAFVTFAIPGLVLAVLIPATLLEPVRGALDPVDRRDTVRASFTDVVRRFVGKPALLHITLGSSLGALVTNGIIAFTSPFFIRNFGVTVQEAGIVLGLTSGASAGVGMLGAGFLTDALSRRDRRWAVWAPAVAFVIALPLYLLAFASEERTTALVLLCIPSALVFIYLPPTFGLLHNMMLPRMRATGTAVLLLSISIVGTGAGPAVVGIMSDHFAQRRFAALGGGVFGATCRGDAELLAPKIQSLCASASAYGVRYALLACSLILLWAAAHYLLAARSLERDL